MNDFAANANLDRRIIPEADDLRRQRLAERHATAERLADAATLLLEMRTWLEPCEARAIIHAIETVHYSYAEMLSATSAKRSWRPGFRGRPENYLIDNDRQFGRQRAHERSNHDG